MKRKEGVVMRRKIRNGEKEKSLRRKRTGEKKEGDDKKGKEGRHANLKDYE